jgi:hypothetical protein
VASPGPGPYGPDAARAGPAHDTAAAPTDNSTSDDTAAAPTDDSTSDDTAAAPTDDSTCDDTAAAPTDDSTSDNTTADCLTGVPLSSGEAGPCACCTSSAARTVLSTSSNSSARPAAARLPPGSSAGTRLSPASLSGPGQALAESQSQEPTRQSLPDNPEQCWTRRFSLDLGKQ